MAQSSIRSWWQKLKQPGKPQTEERRGGLQVGNNLVLHLHPISVPASSLRYWYTWGLGGISTVLMALIGLTGLMLMFRYDARIDFAYISIQQMETEVIFGSLVRAIHHWSANFLVVTTFLHLLRVFFTGSFKQGRAANWLIGLVLFVLVLALNFTGYLLPWDQLAYWAITVSTSLMAYIPLIGDGLRSFFLGGPQVGQAALSNFYALHVVFLTSCVVMLLGYHFWRIRKDGGITHPKPKENEPIKRLLTIPHLVNIELAAILVVIVVVMLWAMSTPAPLGPIANPISSPNPAKAAWYFLGLQELLLHMHPLAALALVALAAVALVAVPFADREDKDLGVYFRSPVGQRSALTGALLGLNLTPVLVVLDEFWIDLPAWLPGLMPEVTTGVLPFIATLLAFVALYFGLRRSALYQEQRANHSEALLGVFAFAVAGFIVMTIIGIFFRGPNMALVLPF